MYDVFNKANKVFNVLILAGVAGLGLDVSPARASSAGAELADQEAEEWGLEDIRSSVHWDMVRALARCAGFDATNARMIANVSEATDVGPPYAGRNFGDRGGANSDAMHWPNVKFASEVNGDNINGTVSYIKDWAKGDSQTLVDPDDELWEWCEDFTTTPGEDGECCYGGVSGTNCIGPGTEKALATALHSIADAYSHKACGLAGGPGHHNYDTGDPDQIAYCEPNNNHGNEFRGVKCTTESDLCGEYDTADPQYSYINGAHKDTTLFENNIDGIIAMRNYIEDWRLLVRGPGSICTNGNSYVTNAEIRTFVNQDSFRGRMLYAQGLYDECDSAAPVGCGEDEWPVP